MVKKNFGWVLYDPTDYRANGLPWYHGGKSGMSYVSDLKDAFVYKTRIVARQIHIIGLDRIRKVSLDTNGRPVAVIGRG